MDVNEIGRILRLLRDTDVAGFRLERDGTVLEIHRAVQGNGPSAMTPGAAGPPTPGPSPAPTALPAAVEPRAIPASAAAPLPQGHTITSPFVGTFYRSPAPDAAPYVDVGQKVRKGQTLCIVEAMKLMNEIEAEVAGTVVQVFPENGSAVEYEAPLFLIAPA